MPRFEELAVGQVAASTTQVDAERIRAFAEVSGDTIPMHLDPAFGGLTRFGGPIAHGILSASFISAVIGTRLPGPGAIYLSQSLRFTAPVRAGMSSRPGSRLEALLVVDDVRGEPA